MQTIRYSDRTSPLQAVIYGISATLSNASTEIKHIVFNYIKILLMVMYEVLIEAGVEKWRCKKLSFFYLTYLTI